MLQTSENQKNGIVADSEIKLPILAFKVMGNQVEQPFNRTTAFVFGCSGSNALASGQVSQALVLGGPHGGFLVGLFVLVAQ